MKPLWPIALTTLLASGPPGFGAARAGTPVRVHASASCTPANKPGRIRCRALVELPLEALATQRIIWGQVAVVSSDPAITPLRGRLGPNDAEAREDGRWVWSFSVAAAEVGDRSMTIRLSSTIEPRSGGAPTLLHHEVVVPVRVAP